MAALAAKDAKALKDDASDPTEAAAFRQGLAEHGRIARHNIHIELRW
jgi:hypothetical protein